jgi:exosortase
MSDSVTKADARAADRAGSLAAMLGPDEAAPAAPRAIPAATWIKIAVLGGLLIAVNFWQFRKLVATWRHDPNWSHGFLIPLFSLYLLYARRDELLGAPRRVCLWGLAILLLGLACVVLGFYPIRNDWFCQLSMILTLFGLVLYLGGRRLMRVAWVPILYLSLAMPIPARLYERIAIPLQGLAASASGYLLRTFGASVRVTALNLQITSISGHTHGVMVAEACSGVRSLLAFVALGVAMAFIERRPAWQRGVLILAGVPIAVVCNILRVALTGAMYVFDLPELGHSFMHEFMGMALLVPALLLLLLLSRLMRSLFIEEEVDESPPGEDAAEPAGRRGGAP